jgi:hypothetical protein
MDTDGLTWKQRRELERELWLEDHLRVLADVRPDDLDDAFGLRAVEVRARMVAELAAKVRRARGDEAVVAAEIEEFRSALEGPEQPPV